MWNDLNTLSAKELKKIAEWMWLVKWEDFKTNASKNDMLKLISSQNNDESSNVIKEDTDKPDEKIITTIDNTEIDNDGEYTVVTPVKRNGTILVKWDSIEYFDWIEKLIKDWIIKES